jgi:hypothetical protein
VLTGDYRELFSVIVETAASLTGLLFVAISLAHSRDPGVYDDPIQQGRAAAAYLAFLNALVVSMFASVPGTNAGYPALVLSFSGILFIVASARSLIEAHLEKRLRNSQISLLFLLILTFGFEIDEAVRLLANPHDTGAIGDLSYVLLASLLIGVARAWELVARRSSGLLSSLPLLAARRSKPKDP